MEKNGASGKNQLPLSFIEPHAQLLSSPDDEELLYKVMSIENLLRSIANSYLHFNRVDDYSDFPGADINDGCQLPKDQLGNSNSKFEKSPDFSAANYYDQSRARTYACCFSLKNANYIWENYASNNKKGKVGVVFKFGKLRALLNETLNPGNRTLRYNGNLCTQIFSINYGIVDYVEWDNHQLNVEHLPNPIMYTFLKDKEKFAKENELRISLSAMGIGRFLLKNGSKIEFPGSLQLGFDFRKAISDGTIQEILYSPDSDTAFLEAELNKLGIGPAR
jgi:hypothetical protein